MRSLCRTRAKYMKSHPYMHTVVFVLFNEYIDDSHHAKTRDGSWIPLGLSDLGMPEELKVDTMAFL